MEYKAQWAYTSSRVTLVPGQVIDLDDEMAKWLMADSPGVIVPVADSLAWGQAPDAPATTRAPDAPGADRMQRQGARRGYQ